MPGHDLRCLRLASLLAAAGAMVPRPAVAVDWFEIVERCRTAVPLWAGEPPPTVAALAEALAKVDAGKTAVDLGISTDASVPDPVSRRKWPSPDEAARVIASTKTLHRIKRLVLDGFPLTPEAARALAGSPHLAALEELSLVDAHVTGPVLHELLAPGAFPALVALDLGGNRFKDTELEALATLLAGRHLRRLGMGARTWHVSTPTMPDVGAAAKARLPHTLAGAATLARVAATPTLELLELGVEPLAAADLEALLRTERKQPLEIATPALARATRKQMAVLAALDSVGPLVFAMAGTSIGASSLRALEASGLLAMVTSLQVDCGDTCAQVIARSKNTARLRELIFGCNDDTQSSDATYRALAHADGLSALRTLAFHADAELCQGAGGVGRTGLAALLKASFAPRLESLTLNELGLGDAGYALLARTKALPALKELLISEEDDVISPATAVALVRDGPLAHQLEVLRILSEGWQWPIATVANSIRMPKLRVFELSPGAAGEEQDWLRLAHAPGLRSVETISLSAGWNGGAVMRALRKHLPAACIVTD